MTPPGSFQEGIADLWAGLRRHWLWRALGRQELRRRYARTLLGPMWSTLSLAVAAGALTVLFARPLGGALPSYPVFVAAGLAIWQFVLATLGEAPAAFVAAADTIRAAPLPLSVFVLRLVWRNLLVLAAQVPVVAAAILLCGVLPARQALLLPLALLLTGGAGIGAALLLATAGARFRDAQPIVASALQLLFFVTPIFWSPAMLPPERAWLVNLNPLAAFVEIVRAPLLGTAATGRAWAVAAAVAVLLLASGILVFGRCRARLAYWT